MFFEFLNDLNPNYNFKIIIMANFKLTDSQRSKAGLIPKKDKAARKLNIRVAKRKRTRIKYRPKDESESFQEDSSE